ncbi:MAG: von Willebrand factor type A domain-containing protein [Sphaerochaetaceae bacterium]|nr:von Willebrand factor type A domain-containing protein [Sphaerochaetaceae bacterium]
MKQKRYYLMMFIILVNIYILIGCTSASDEEQELSITENVEENVALVNNENFEVDAIISKPIQPVMALEATPMMAKSLNSAIVVPISTSEMNTEEYDRINENTFKSVLENPVSTFSIDVDTASYTNVRRYLLQNEELPPKDAVRIEEFLQYFSYDYKQPEGDNSVSYQLDMEEAPWNVKHKLLRVAIQAKEIKTEDLPPSNLVFLLDTSGSMRSDNKLPLLQKSMRVLVEQLRPQDTISIVAYAGSAGVILESTPGTDKTTITRAFTDLKAGGATAGSAGIELAYKIAEENYIKGGNNRVILCTDGDFNVGVSSTGALERLIEEKREKNIYLTILGLGMGNYKDSRMESLSNIGNGNYAYIDNLLEGKKVLGKEIWGNLFAVAKDVKVQVEFNPKKVSSYRLIGYENRLLNREDFNDDNKDAGEMGSGQSVTAFYELVLADSEDNEVESQSDSLVFQKSTIIPSQDILSFKLRYKKPADGDEQSQFLSVIMDEADLYNNQGETDLDFTFASAVVEFGMLLRDSPFKGNSSWEHVISQAKASKATDENGYRSEFIKLVEIAELLDSLSDKD